MSLTIRELEEAHDNINPSSELSQVIRILLDAVNDWPTKVSTIDEYDKAVHAFIGGEVLPKEVRKSLKSINFQENAWESESLSQLVSIFDFFPDGLDLKEIAKAVKNELEGE